MEDKVKDKRKRYNYGAFECPRCLFCTTVKQNIKTHFNRKIPCPCSNPKGFELTEEIKEHVYKNRKWKPEKETKPKQINNYIQINNTLNAMDYPEKATRYVKYLTQNSSNCIGIREPIIQSYKDQVNKALFDGGFDTDSLKLMMTDPSVKEFTEHTYEDHIGAIDLVTKRPDVPNCLVGIMYDAKTKKMYLYDENTWEDLQEKPGVKKLIMHIRDLYWNTYEKYLVRKIRTHNNILYKQKARELLTEYYTFLYSFDLKPDCHQEEDDAYAVWKKVISQTKISVKNNMYKDIMLIIRNNSSSNIKLLNKDIAKLIKVDTDFESTFFQDQDQEQEQCELEEE